MKTQNRFPIVVLAFATLLLAPAGGCSVTTAASGVICTPDQTTMCTNCKRPKNDDRQYRGKHTCSHDGTSFGTCTQCEPVSASESPEQGGNADSTEEEGLTGDDVVPTDDTLTTQPSSSSCNTLTIGTPVSSDYDGAFPIPAGGGGTLSDGSYVLTAWTKFKGHQHPGAEIRADVIRITEGGRAAERAWMEGEGKTARATYSVAFNGITNRLVFTKICPKDASSSLSYSFRAVGRELTLYDPSTNEAFDFAQ